MKITIYLSEATRNKLKEIQKEYRISLSTIGQILTDNFRPNFTKYSNEFFTEYLEKEHRNKTMIKPNNIDELTQNSSINLTLNVLSHVYTNIMYLWANKQYEYLYQITDKKVIEKSIKQINKIFFKKKEYNWDYNNSLRMQVRIVKKNPEYFKKLLA